MLISEFAQVVAGGTPSTSQVEYWNGNIPWITPKDISQLKGKYVSKTTSYITEKGIEKSSATLFPENSVILSTRAPVGYLAINTVPMTSNQGIKAIVCDPEKCSPEFLYYLLKTKQRELEQQSSGSTFKELPTSGLKNFNIELPTMNIQLRIANIHELNLNDFSPSEIFLSSSRPCAVKSSNSD